MANIKKKESERTDEEILAEIKMLSQKAQENRATQLDMLNDLKLGDEDISNSFDKSIFSDTADPDESHRLYYTMRKIMIDNLPKGKNNLKLRRYIYDEKILFLNRGKLKDDFGRRGSDERMAYINNFLNIAFDIITNWVRNGANPYDLYTSFYNLNEEKGYHSVSNNENSTV